ncbi:tape measure protein [Ottowia testudinis]|uniref:Phage tail tape measure protein n=1 Tax=Ottowia testudinis TaxID=2816950 RepID=A0A975CHP5_9BURK|nr:tape measure protein [Ottowia testudinis]QTD44384.1 phage tail tape measure protein [Ottowia testudinis]
MPTNRISVLVSLEGQDDKLRATLTQAEKNLGDLANQAKSAGAQASAGLEQVKAGAGAFAEQFGRAKAQLVAFLAAFQFAGQVREIIQLADAWNLMEARLKLATAGTREFTVAKQELFAIAQRIGVPIQEVTTLYGKLQQAVRMLGGEQKDAFTITESISQALRISGASATEAQSALLQFGQALASGVLRGEEFNSVVENSPRLAQALADGLNVPIGRLRAMAEQGQLTADVVVRALLSQKDKLAAEYSQLPATVSQSLARLQNAFAQYVHQLDESTGFTRKLATALDWLSQHLDTVMSWLNTIKNVGLAVLIYRFLPALVTAWQTAGVAAVTAAQMTAASWAVANQSVLTAIASVGLLKVAFAVLAAAFIGWEIGTWLSENFTIVRKAGIFMVQVLMTGVEQLRYQWELFAALFTSDTLAAATQRHQERMAQMRATFADMYRDAEGQGAAAANAMNSAASAAEEINRRLQAVRQGTQEAVGRGVEAVNAAIEKLNGRISEVEGLANKAHQTVSDALSKIATGYQGLTSLIQSGLDAQLAAVQRNAEAQKAALELSNASQAQAIAKSTEILTTSLQQQTTLRQQATTQTLALIDQESKARLDAAAREGTTEAERRNNVARVENEILATKRSSLQEALNAYIAHINALNQEANRHLAEVQRIEQAKRDLQQSTADKIRELQRSTMSEFEAYQDKQTQIQELQAKAREAIQAGEFDKAREYAKQATDLAAQTANAVKQGDKEVVSQKEAVQKAIEAIKASEELTVQALNGEQKAHKQAADAAISARGGIEQALKSTQTQIDEITAKLKDGLKLTIDIDQTRLQTALAELDKALAEKERLIPIKADLEQARKQLMEYEQLLKDGKTLPVDADVSKAQAALQQLSDYAKDKAEIELKVSSDKALAGVQNVQRSIAALNDLETQSKHLVRSNADEARAAIQSLNGQNTSSTHTIYVKKVEANASGGLVGTGSTATSNHIRGFATGGAVGKPASGGMALPSMAGGKVPGSGNADTVPRTLDAGSFVLKKAAVQKYGDGLLGKLARGAQAVRHFAAGGTVKIGGADKQPEGDGAWGDYRGISTPKMNREVAEVYKMIELGIESLRNYTSNVQWQYGAAVSLDFGWNTMKYAQDDAQRDRKRLEDFKTRKTLTPNEKQDLERMKQRWRTNMAQMLLYNKDYERDLIDYMEANQDNFLARGGQPKSSGTSGAQGGATSDTVAAMLTPGEFVMNKATVNRFGAGFFAALNNLSLPKERVQTVLGFATGGMVPGMLGAASSLSTPVQQMARQAMQSAAPAAPARTVRVELASGGQKVDARIDEQDESRLLQLLASARTRMA